MIVHPFTESISRKTAGVAIALLLAAATATLLIMYGNVLPTAAIADALFYVAVLSLIAYYYWYVIGFFQVFQSQVAIAIVVQLVCLATTLALLAVFELEDLQTFIYNIPIRMSISILSWIVLQQWYSIERDKKLPPEEDISLKEQRNTQAAVEKEAAEILDRISVKDGATIHLIMTDEILYAQAYGDYVTFFTSTGKYVKEITMKFLEANLPDSFIRIHRSYIVNTSYIVRIELFGKQTYQLRLKDNTCLRISSNGYKLLKDKLML